MKGYEGHSVVVAELVVKAHESHSVGRHTNDTNLASCARPLDFMGLAAPGGVRGGLPRNLLPKTARNGFADLNGSGMGSQLPLLPLLSSAVPKLRARSDMNLLHMVARAPGSTGEGN